MKVSLECTYCGHIWFETVYHKGALDGKTCVNGSCRHKQLILRDLKDKVDHYKGCPPFPEKQEEKIHRWNTYGMD